MGNFNVTLTGSRRIPHFTTRVSIKCYLIRIGQYNIQGYDDLLLSHAHVLTFTTRVKFITRYVSFKRRKLFFFFRALISIRLHIDRKIGDC